MPKTEKDLSIENIQKRHHQLQVIINSKSVPITTLSRELGVKPTTLMDVIDNNPKLFSLAPLSLLPMVGKKKSVLTVKDVYLNPGENPDTQEWLDKKIIDCAKTVYLEHYDNYGYISGHYIEPSKHNKEPSYLNTKEKIMMLAERFQLKKAVYFLGGFGDCSTLRPEGGYEITPQIIGILKSEGWNFLNEKELSK